jgi:hypothetical protein
VTVAKRKSSDTVARKTFSVSRLAEFASIPELIKATGQPVENWALVVVKELADNAADEAEEAGVLPVIEITVEADAITVSDQGRGIKPAVVKALVDYATKTSAAPLSSRHREASKATRCRASSPWATRSRPAQTARW